MHFFLIGVFIVFFSLILPNFSFSKKILSIIEPVKNLGKNINTKAHEFAPVVSFNGSFMIFNSKRNSRYQDLYISHFDFKKKVWQKPTPLKVLNSPYNDETPFLSSDGKFLVFSSDRDGSGSFKTQNNQIKVSFDLYLSQRRGNIWSKPIRIPGEVNTMHHEKSPSLSKDNKKLYYTMWKFGDIKNTIILQAMFKNGRFVSPAPMPALINAGFQELALIESESQDGYFFSSMRPGGMGGWDIYYVAHKDGNFGNIINLGKNINSAGNEAFISRVDQQFFISSNRKGGKGGFDIYSTFIFRNDKKFESRTIFFDFNSSNIKNESYPYLNALARFLRKNPKKRLKIIGHTDMHGSKAFNHKLSEDRANSVKKYLVRKGIPKNRLGILGKGETNPVINKIGPEYDQQNRRTEFQWLD